LSGKDTRGWLC
jgi:precorrin-2 dehydrogenase / sirohydrochlorin ferrochelatase